MGERRSDLSGLLQYLHNGRSNISEVNYVTVLVSIKCRKLIMNLPDASNTTAVLTADATGSSIPNEATLEIDSHSDLICTQKPLSVAEELDKVIKEGYVHQCSLLDLRHYHQKFKKKGFFLKMEGDVVTTT
ncbi:hypothetical protein TNCV_3101121 [Trichonephila clavipes]|nr:hypothetical protein TNCV_3101121 [Trichonephila clavipes]